ncbi:GLE1-like protein-domain-containing protein [Geopyxis carbonaria]|nr:GLE1-like protein-domain-containing protein [Geopyxis carbonaria]
MSTPASKPKTPSSVARYATKQFDPESIISPEMRKLLPTPKSAGSYGCEREVYHPLSPNAEPSALFFYDSDDDPEDEGVDTETPSRNHLKGKGPMPNNIAAHVGPISNSPKPVAQSQGHSTEPKKTSARISKSTLSATPVIPSPSTKKRSSGDPSSPTKRTRNTTENIFTGRILDYGSASGGSDVGSSSESDPDAEKLSSSLPGSFSAFETKSSQEIPNENHNERAQITSSGAQGVRRNVDQPAVVETPSRNRPLSLSSVSPRRMPLPDSPGDMSEVGSEDGYPVSPSQELRIQHDQFSPVVARTNMKQKNASATHAEEITQKLQILNIKAQQYSEAITYTPSDRELVRELEKIYTNENRFDPEQARLLEDVWQGKVRAVVAKEEQRQHDLRVAEQARIEEERRLREAEAARIAAEQQRRREEQERHRRQQEEEERRRREEEGRVQAEKERVEVEKKRLAEEKTRQENEAKQKAQQQISAQNQAQAQAQRNAQQSAQQSPAQDQPVVPGRISQDVENASIDRIIANLKEVKKICENEDFMRENGLSKIVRDCRPKVAQLTGDKTQTITSRNYLKTVFVGLLEHKGPKRMAADFILHPGPEQEIVDVPVIFIYLVNQLAKILTRQVSQEGGAKTKSADPLGVVISSTFADPRFLVSGKSFVDIFIARILKKCPPLRGYLGPETTEADKYRMGWMRFEDSEMWEDLEPYCGRMRGLVSGYVSIAGRDFGISSLQNPYPMFNLWYRVAYMLNSPPEKLLEVHYECMKTIIVTSGEKMVKIYGPQAKKLILLAVTDWAQAGIPYAPSGATAVHSLSKTLLKEDWWTGKKKE